MYFSSEPSFTDSKVEEQARGVLGTRFGTAIAIPVEEFLARVLPPLLQGLSTQDIASEDHWSDLGQDPSTTKCDPSPAANYLPAAVSAIMKAGDTANRPCKSMFFRNNPVYVEGPYDQELGGLPNAYLLLGEDATWTNVVASGEYMKTDSKENRRDNIFKVTTSMAECMCRDPRRRFTFAYTLEDTSMRLWYCDRGQIIVSEAFDFIADREPMIHFFLSLICAEPCQLGWDPTMTLLEDGHNFDIRVDGLDGMQRVYRTLQLLSRPGLHNLKGKGTRVWKAVLVEDNEARGGPVVLKDTWAEPDRKPEGYILEEIRALPVQTATHSQDRVAGAFPTPLCHGYVYLDRDRGHLDHVPLLTSSVDNTSAVETPPKLPVWAELPGGQSTVEEPAVLKNRFRVHYRIVFREVGRPICQEQCLPLVYKMLAQIVYALHHLQLAGWVHRDVSPYNILIVEDRAILIDLEYARKEGQGKEYRMGTPGFIAAEVDLQKYNFRWVTHKSDSPPPTQEKLVFEKELVRRLWLSRSPDDDDLPDSPSPVVPPVILPEEPPSPTFRHNALHDLESLWWVAVYFIFKRRIVDETKEPPSAEDIMGLADQCRWAHLLFENEEQRCGAVLRTGIAERMHVLHPVAQPILLLLEGLRKRLWSAYAQKEEDPEVVELKSQVHPAFISRLLDLASVSLAHIKLLPLPPLDSCGKVVVSQVLVLANQETKHSTGEQPVEKADGVVVGGSVSAHRGTKRSADEPGEVGPGHEDAQERSPPSREAKRSASERPVDEAEDVVVQTPTSVHRGTKRSADELAEDGAEELDVRERSTKRARPSKINNMQGL